jgi:hypothetical protein
MEYIESLTVYELIGLAGAGSYMAGYASLQFGLIRGRGAAYILFNMVAALLVMISLLNAFNISSMLIQLFFFIVSIFGLIRLYFESRPVKARANELLVAESLFPGLPKRRALAVIKKGNWMLAHGGNLTTQDKPVNQLFVIVEGTASVLMNGQIISTVSRGGIIGDMTCFSTGTATATTNLSKHSLVFSIEAAYLSSVFERDEEMATAFEDGKHSALQERLFQANAHLCAYKSEAILQN